MVHQEIEKPPPPPDGCSTGPATDSGPAQSGSTAAHGEQGESLLLVSERERGAGRCWPEADRSCVGNPAVRFAVVVSDVCAGGAGGSGAGNRPGVVGASRRRWRGGVRDPDCAPPPGRQARSSAGAGVAGASGVSLGGAVEASGGNAGLRRVHAGGGGHLVGGQRVASARACRVAVGSAHRGGAGCRPGNVAPGALGGASASVGGSGR